MFNLQRYPWNRNLIKTVEDNIVFWLKKRIPNSYLIRQIIQGYRTLLLLVKYHCSFSRSQYFHLQFSAKFRIHLWLDNEIDRKIYITAMQFLSVQNRQQTHGWTLIGSGAYGMGKQVCFAWRNTWIYVYSPFKWRYHRESKIAERTAVLLNLNPRCTITKNCWQINIIYFLYFQFILVK